MGTAAHIVSSIHGLLVLGGNVILFSKVTDYILTGQYIDTKFLHEEEESSQRIDCLLTPPWKFSQGWS